jgi:serine/threonine-protein kinase
MRRAREADPISPLIKASEGLVLYQARRYVEALEEARQNIQMNPEFFPPHRLLGMVHIQQGGYAEAIDDLQEALRLQNDSFCLGRLGYAYARAGRNSDANRVLDGMKAESTRSYLPAYQIGLVYAGLGNADQVFSWFDKACEDRDPDILMIKVEPLLDGLRADPRFTALLRKMHLQS